MKRREFIAGLGGATLAWLSAALAQQPDRVRRVGLLMSVAESDPQGQLRVAAFHQGLAKLGWTDGRNIRIDTRWGAGDIDHARAPALELVGLPLDVLLATNTPQLVVLRQAARSIPIVFAGVTDPVGSGLVASLARPGGNITGFMLNEPPMAGKWVELLKEMAPSVQRAAFLFSPENAPSAREFLAYAEAAAARLKVEMTVAAAHNGSDIEDVFAALTNVANGGLVVNLDAFTIAHRQQIVALAARHRLPAIYPSRFYVTEGGLISYGIDPIDPYRQAASYIDRILRGEKPSDLPVQAPTKFEVVINLETAKTLGLKISETLLATADEVIQ